MKRVQGVTLADHLPHAAAPNEEGGYYWVEIMVPGSIVGLIVG